MQTWTELLDAERVATFAAALARIAVIALLAWATIGAIGRVVERARNNWLRASAAFARRGVHSSRGVSSTEAGELEKRSRTIARLARQALSAMVITVAMLSIADQAGFEIRALLGAVGILSLAIGFGARHLVQDLVTGVFLLLEDQIREGDSVRLGKASGLVEEINLRHVRLRSGDGTVHIIPNGAINSVSNLSQQFSFYVWDLKVSYHADLDAVAAILVELGFELRADPALAMDILDDLEILGVDAYHAHGPILKMRIKTMPRRQWVVGRAFNRRIKQRFDELGIAFPLPARRLYPGDAPPPLLSSREALKQQVRALLAEGSLPV
ncbi:MAG: mechanosensitive ion channel family protein [Bryobacterales bacterium]|nr:mechanosensitive ion channel family protein [Bryobacterales bacterium]